MLIEKAKFITKKIISDLLDRSGFDGWWDQIDNDIQNEIKETMTKIILNNSVDNRE